jgi:hypothetical protein
MIEKIITVFIRKFNKEKASSLVSGKNKIFSILNVAMTVKTFTIAKKTAIIPKLSAENILVSIGEINIVSIWDINTPPATVKIFLM